MAINTFIDPFFRFCYYLSDENWEENVQDNYGLRNPIISVEWHRFIFIGLYDWIILQSHVFRVVVC